MDNDGLRKTTNGKGIRKKRRKVIKTRKGLRRGKNTLFSSSSLMVFIIMYTQRLHTVPPIDEKYNVCSLHQKSSYL
jgi:hypothetical protein